MLRMEIRVEKLQSWEPETVPTLPYDPSITKTWLPRAEEYSMYIFGKRELKQPGCGPLIPFTRVHPQGKQRAVSPFQLNSEWRD